jgi:hypothetical protein
VSRAAQDLDVRFDVRSHRKPRPNQRPLLVSLILVALTAVPSMIVVLAGTASLDSREGRRPPLAADGPNLPVVIEPDTGAGLGNRPDADAEAVRINRAGSFGTRGPAHMPAPPAAGVGGGSGSFPGIGKGATSGAGSPGRVEGGTVPGSVPGTDPGTVPAPPGDGSSGAAGGSSGSAGSSSGSAGGSAGASGGSGGGPSVPPPGDGTPPTGCPRSGYDGRIDDRAWPGWDRALQQQPESAPLEVTDQRGVGG